MTKKIVSTNQKKQQETHDEKLYRKWLARGGVFGTGPAQHIGTIAGAVGGSYFGSPHIGAALGGAMGHGVGYYSGTGDYQYHNNFAAVKNNACTVPGFNRNNDSVVVCHREYIQDVISGAGAPSAFTATVLPLNPGYQPTFPWLATIAANYEEYEIQGMVFEYVSTSGASVASANTALGTVIMATEYDPTKPAFSNKQAMENYSFATSSRPSENFSHAIECKKTRTPSALLYVRTGSNTGSDLRWTDFGNFTIATIGTQAATTTLGELWVTYKVKLLKPRLPITLGLAGQVPSTHIYRTGSASATPLGTATTRVSGPTAVTVTGTSLVWFAEPLTKWTVTVCISAATSTTSLTTGGGLQNLAGLNIFQDDTNSFYSVSFGQFGVYTLAMTTTNVNDGANVVLNFAPNVIVGAAFTDIVVTQIDTTITS